jgi:hypothetical protein
MKGLLQGSFVLMAAIVGICAGGALGYFATYYAVVFFWPQAYQIGWIFCVATIPLGACIGRVVGARVTAQILPRVSKADQKP